MNYGQKNNFDRNAPVPFIGPPVDWDHCLRCGGKLKPEEERFRVELKKDEKIGVGHKEGTCGL